MICHLKVIVHLYQHKKKKKKSTRETSHVMLSFLKLTSSSFLI